MAKKNDNAKKVEDIISSIDQAFGETEWHGIKIRVKSTLSLEEMMMFVKTVVDNCFDDENCYAPEVFDFVFNHELLRKYTDLLKIDTEIGVGTTITMVVNIN